MDKPLVLEGAPNFRDAGGYRTECGRRLRQGLLFRSGRLSELTGADRAAFDKLGIRLACDLRSQRERDDHPSGQVAPEARWLAFDVGADLRAGESKLTGILGDDPTARGVRQMMLATYRLLPGACAPHLRSLFAHLAAADALPVLLFCTAGKDRTGFLVAMVQHALGVPLDAIRTDYLKSNAYTGQMRLSPATGRMLARATGKEPDQAMIDLLASVDADYLATAFDTIDREYGSAESYLRRACGLDVQRRRRLQELLLE